MMKTRVMDYKEFLFSAEKMIEVDQAEVTRRNCISRAYYGAYHACLAASQQLGMQIVDVDAGVHVKLIKTLKLRKDTVDIGRDLDTLKKLRNKADYVLRSEISVRDAKSAIKQANLLINDVEKLFESEDQSGEC